MDVVVVSTYGLKCCVISSGVFMVCLKNIACIVISYMRNNANGEQCFFSSLRSELVDEGRMSGSRMVDVKKDTWPQNFAPVTTQDAT